MPGGVGHVQKLFLRLPGSNKAGNEIPGKQKGRDVRMEEVGSTVGSWAGAQNKTFCLWISKTYKVNSLPQS